MRILDSNILTVALLLVLVVVSVLALNYAFQPTLDRAEWREEIYSVKSGDSLWGIATEYCPGNVDRREWIDEVRTLNDMSNSVIQPGQKLIVLAPVK